MKSSGPTFTIPVSTSGKIIFLYGNMFNYKTLNGLYLSSNNFDGTQGYYNLYSNTRSVSAANPPFSAYPVYDYTVSTNNTLHFTLSAFKTVQKLDIIYANPAGYNFASKGKRFTYIQIISSL
jgi:hypothetical protein